jgi:hypothetical protein
VPGGFDVEEKGVFLVELDPWVVVSLLSPASGGTAMERRGVAGSVEVLLEVWFGSVMAAGR